MSSYMRDNAIQKGTVLGVEYLIAPSPLYKKWLENKDGYQDEMRRIDLRDPILSGLNGYAVFPKCPVRERGTSGILSYVPVHWGITWHNHEGNECTIGFDTGHGDSDKVPRTDPEWIKGQIRQMVKGIKKAAEVERSYLRCTSNKGKAKWAQMVLDTAPKEKTTSMNMMLNMLSGKL